MFPIPASTCTEAWFRAATHLKSQDDWCDYTGVLEIESPMRLTEQDHKVQTIVDQFLVSHERFSVNTVVNTIFPAGLYTHHHNGLAVLDHFETLANRISEHEDVKWGTYALRMNSRIGPDQKPFSPLRVIIAKLQKTLASNNPKRAIFELNLIDPLLDIPIYDATADRNYHRGGPCLSHLSFKLRPDRKLMLTAFYRSHYYIQRALGNLYGLAWLQHFVAEQAGLETGPLVCISSLASLETGKDAGWKVSEVNQLLAECAKVYSPAAGAALTVKK